MKKNISPYFPLNLEICIDGSVGKKLRKKLNEKGLLDEKGEVTKYRGVVIGQKIPGCPK